MALDVDYALLDACLQSVGVSDFEPSALDDYDLSDIGGAAVRIAQNVLAGMPFALRHPLGFGRIPLTPWRLDAPRVAVHIWYPGTSLSEDIHDHCYDFVSLCHVGALEHRLFQANPRGEQGNPAKSLTQKPTYARAA